MAELFVTNFNRNFTGVSATAANVLRAQLGHYDLALVGQPLPGCPAPITRRQALAASKTAPRGRPFAIWHVRRNPEMRAAIWARDVLRLPLRIVFTSAAQRLHSAYPRWLISKMDAVIATTPRAADFVPHVRAVVGHGVDTDLFTPARDRQQAWQALGYGGDFGIATIGRIRPEKGTDLFVDAMLRLLPEFPKARALIIGRAGGKHDSFEQGLRDRVQAAGLADRLLFAGEIPSERLPETMRALSLDCQLPRYEGFGMVPLEAMASGVPFVSTDAGAYREFANGPHGIVVPAATAQQVAQTAQTMLARLHSTNVAQTARDTALSQFSAAQEARGIDQVYQSLWNTSGMGA
jgi:mannosyltransferase